MRTSAQTLASNPPPPLPPHHPRPPMLLQRFHPTLSTSLFQHLRARSNTSTQHFSGARSSGMLISKEEASEMELALIMHMRKCTCAGGKPIPPANSRSKTCPLDPSVSRRHRSITRNDSTTHQRNVNPWNILHQLRKVPTNHAAPDGNVQPPRTAKCPA